MECRLHTAWAWVVVIGVASSAAASDDGTLVQRCAELLVDATQGDPAITPDVLLEAKALLIAPGVIDRQLGVGLRTGEGIVVVRQENGGWGKPQLVKFSGGSVGFAGRTVTDTIMVFNVPVSAEEALQRYKLNSFQVMIGIDLNNRSSWSSDIAEPGRNPDDLVSTYRRSRGMVVGGGMSVSNIRAAGQAQRRSWLSTVFGSHADVSPVQFDNASLPTSDDVAHLQSTLARIATPPAVEMAAVPIPHVD